MKKVLIALLLLLASTGQVWANENFGVSLGAKVWYMNWSTWFPLARNSNIALNADSEFVVVPSATIRLGKFFLNGSYALPTDFSFYEFDTETNTNIRMDGEREEYDVNLGFKITPNLAATIGWKDVTQTFTYPGTTGSDEWNWSGPTLGLAGNAMMSEKFGMYGNLAYGIMDVNAASMDSAEYLSYELGLVFVPVSAFNMTLGYKSQFIDSEFKYSSDDIAHDVTRGVVLGANFNF